MKHRNIFAFLLIIPILTSISIYWYVNEYRKIPDLKSIVEMSLNQTEGKFGIFIKNFKTQESYFLNEDGIFESGSFYKLKLMVLVFEQIKEGKLAEDRVLSADIKDLNDFFDIPEEDAELKEGEIEMSVKDALEQMITISHNYAALLLTKETGAKDLAGPITPKELGEFFENLYQGEIIDQEYSAKILDLLSRQKVNDRIPKYLPEGVKIAHKTGDIEYFEHDGGIVFTPYGDYITVILTETGSPTKAGEKIAEISREVYKYFSN